ncbi:hypothetical protein M2168_005886 [Streptomyces sp. CZ24]|uniref:hypothetical protein n=1 Tax=Streptomyces albidoflavus TaxID=1886 RepID=UPI0011C4C6DE|nr:MULTISPECIES: hypothetical protein [Streptomyces]MDH6192854.1 hypothetical protein [Streptomyces sp. CZ24]
MGHRRPAAGGPDLPGDHRQRATPAQAAPVEAAGKKVSSCVKTATFDQPSVYTVQGRNTCTSSVKVKIVMRLGKDSPCTTIKKGGYYTRDTKAPAPGRRR